VRPSLVVMPQPHLGRSRRRCDARIAHPRAATRSGIYVLPYSAFLALQAIMNAAVKSAAVGAIIGVRSDVNRMLKAQDVANIVLGALAALPVATAASQSVPAARMSVVAFQPRAHALASSPRWGWANPIRKPAGWTMSITHWNGSSSRFCASARLSAKGIQPIFRIRLSPADCPQPTWRRSARP